MVDPKIPDDHSEIDLRFVTTPRHVVLYFVAKSQELMELVKTNDFDSALILVEETLNNYNLYTAKKLPKAAIMNVREAINSFEACWKLSSTICGIKGKTINIHQLNFSEIKEQINTAYYSTNTANLFCKVLEQLSPIFLENYLMVAANSCIQIVMNTKIKQEKRFYNKVSMTDAYSAGIQDLGIQLEYMVRVFSFSNKVREDSSFEIEGVRAEDKIFKDLLLQMGVQDLCYMPSIVKTREEAEKLFNNILYKLEAYKALVQQDDPLSEDTNSVEVYNFSTWNAMTHHFMSFFEEDPQKKITWLIFSVNTFDGLMREGFSRELIRTFFVVEPQREIQRHYRTVLDKNYDSYQILIKHGKEDVLNADPEDVGPMINQLNIYHFNLIQVCEDILHFISWNEIAPELQKGWVLLGLGTALRSLILDSEVEQKIYFDQALKYFKRFAKITNSEEFKKHNPDYVGLTVEEQIQSVDQDSYIQKFRIHK